MSDRPAAPRLTIGLNAVVTALRDSDPHVLCAPREGSWALPYGPFDPARHRTFEIGMRDFVERQTGLRLPYVEQLYTFGDAGREVARARLAGGQDTDRVVSVGYLALTPRAGETGLTGAAWRGWYEYFPWEDRREGDPEALAAITEALGRWADTEERAARVEAAFGARTGWQEERALDRYELMYEAGLVEEAARDGGGGTPLPGTGPAMASDHRRILATAIGRLRGKLRYRPVAFELMGEAFTLTDLQEAIEAVLGFRVHKQNFRRALAASGLAEPTGETAPQGKGRPAALHRRAGGAPASTGFTLPRAR